MLWLLVNITHQVVVIGFSAFAAYSTNSHHGWGLTRTPSCLKNRTVCKTRCVEEMDSEASVMTSEECLAFANDA